MKSVIKNWLLPPSLLKLLLEFYYSVGEYKRGSFKLIKNNKSLKGIQKGKTCYILGNGPSIKDLDLSQIDGEHTFVVSNFYFHEDYEKLKPKYHVIVRIYDDCITKQDQKKWLKDIEQKCLSEYIFFDARQHQTIQENNLFKSNKIFYISTINKECRSFDLSKITKSHRTSPLMCLEIAIYMGYRNIYLCGVEMNTICTKKYEYFFDRSKMFFKDENVEDDCSVSKKNLELLKTDSKVFDDFDAIAKYATKHNINIYNLSKQSMLDMFERK